MAVEFAPFDFMKHGRWVKDNIQCILCEDTKGIIALKDGKIIAGMIADSWTYTTCQAHLAVLDKAAFRAGIQYEFANYVFNVCCRDMMIGLIPADNEKALKINRHFGFKEEHRIKDGFKRGVDYVIMTMNRAECRYLPKKQEVA